MDGLKKLSSGIFILVIAVSLFAQNDPLSQAYDLFQAKKYTEALAICKELVEKDPNYATAQALLGRIYFALGDLDKAKVCIDKAIDLDRGNNEFREVRTQMVAFISKLTEASQLATNADYAGAKKVWLEVIKQNPNFVDAYFNLGGVYFRLNILDSAAFYLRTAMEKNPTEEKYGKILKSWVSQKLSEGENLRQRRNSAGALAKYQEALQLDPNEFLGYYLSAVVKFDDKQYEEAIAFIDKALAINLEHSKSYLVKGQALEKLNRLEEALSTYQAAVKLDPSYEIAWDKIGVLLYNQKKFDEALEAYLHVLSINPQNFRVLEKIGQIYIDKNNPQEALDYLKKSIEYQGNDPSPRTLLRLAQVYNNLGQCQEAKTTCETALKLKPNDSLVLIELGVAERCLGNKPAARQAFQLAGRDPQYKRLADEYLKTVQ